jgi:hypothetical protein
LKPGRTSLLGNQVQRFRQQTVIILTHLLKVVATVFIPENELIHRRFRELVQLPDLVITEDCAGGFPFVQHVLDTQNISFFQGKNLVF